MASRDRCAGGRRRAVPALAAFAVLAGGATASGWPYGLTAVAAQWLERDAAQSVVVLLREGDQPAGGDDRAVIALGLPTVDGRGRVAFTGLLGPDDDPDGFLWRDGAILFRSSEAGLGALAPAMGSGDGEPWVVQSRLGERDVVWSHRGPVVRQGDPAPGIAGATLLLSRRPSMLPGGRAFWVSEFRDGPGQQGKGRVLYTSVDGSAGAVEVVLRSDQLVDGVPISRPAGVDTEYQVSPSGAHHVHLLYVDTAPGNTVQAVYVDGRIALAGGGSTGGHDRWLRFRNTAINDGGDYLVGGTTDAPVEFDTVIAWNGRVVLREGESVRDTVLEKQASVLGLALDGRRRAAHLWSIGGFGLEYLFLACDAGRLADSEVLLRSRQPLELDGRPGADAVLLGFADIGHGPAIAFAGNRIWVEVELGDPVAPHERHGIDAVLGVRVPACVVPVAAG